eukprot:5354022-Amphidinium_carterae.2
MDDTITLAGTDFYIVRRGLVEFRHGGRVLRTIGQMDHASVIQEHHTLLDTTQEARFPEHVHEDFARSCLVFEQETLAQA